MNRRIEPRAGLRRKPKDFLLVDLRQPTAFDDDFAIDDNCIDAAAVLTEDQLARHVVERCKGGRL